jgi:hypothetical protein
VAECLLCKLKALNSNPSPQNNRKEPKARGLTLRVPIYQVLSLSLKKANRSNGEKAGKDFNVQEANGKGNIRQK